MTVRIDRVSANILDCLYNLAREDKNLDGKGETT